MREAWRVVALAVTREVYLPLVVRQASFIHSSSTRSNSLFSRVLASAMGVASQGGEEQLVVKETTATRGCREGRVYTSAFEVVNPGAMDFPSRCGTLVGAGTSA